MPIDHETFKATKRLLGELRASGKSIARSHNMPGLADYDPASKSLKVPRGKTMPVSSLWHSAGLASDRPEVEALRQTRAAAAQFPEVPTARVKVAQTSLELQRSAHAAAVAKARSMGVGKNSVAAYKQSVRADVKNHSEALREEIKAASGGKFPERLKPLLRRTFARQGELLVRLHEMHGRLVALEQARGADGSFKSGTSIDAKSARLAYTRRASMDTPGRAALKRALLASLRSGK